MSVQVLSLDGSWKLKDAETAQGEAQALYRPGLDTSGWMKTSVPGDVHPTLVAEGRIEDPYVGRNNEKCRWTSQRDWWYRRSFTVPASFEGERIELVFDGIDTYATVWLNGQKIGETSNMFKQYRFDVDEPLNREGENTLAICIHGTLPIIEAMDPKKYFACFYTPRIFVRKTQCQFSWDWAPFLPSIGIWLGARLEAMTENKISDVHVRTRLSGDVAVHVLLDQRRTQAPDALDQKKARDQEAANEAALKDLLLIQITDGETTVEGTIEVTGRKNFINLRIPNPKLWWPLGYGEPHLYRYRVALQRGKRVIDVKEGRFGIREVKLIEDPRDAQTTSFYFKINGVEIFCQGANKVPNDCFPATITRERYERMIALAKDANMNMIRLWGGGMYEKDEFYDLCDEHGIMIWHDLMFACSDIPDDDPRFLDAVLGEFVYQLKRLRNHPSIVYWCGCNEKTGSAGEKITFGDKIYHSIGRGVVADLMPDVPYRPASPHSFNDAGNHPNTGDTHAGAWEDAYRHGMQNFRKFVIKIKPVFHSEFGMHGPCQLRSIKKFIPAESLWPLNDVWNEHIHDNPYSSLEETFMQVQEEASELLFHKPDSAAEFVKVAGTLHAEILRAEFENDRQNKFANAGSMCWMINDCWPSASWSLIDYYGIPKQPFYAVKRALAPVLVSIREEDEQYKICLTNDLLHGLAGKLVFELQTVEGQVVFSKTLDVRVAANISQVVGAVAIKDLPEAVDSYLFAKFTWDEGEVQTTHFHKLWHAVAWPEPGLTCKVAGQRRTAEGHELELELATQKFARCVFLGLEQDAETIYSDNFFDMIAGKIKRVTVRSAKAIDPASLKVHHWKTLWE